MSNTKDTFEHIAEDSMDLLIDALEAWADLSVREQALARILIGVQAADICKRAIALKA
jgi:hypothetical protein